ncbi:hypothetical protein CKM354_000672900 [Cercospora kikuchii]|uniref:Uncharacterized protein n=1 Tax=Cercospora kikuchii TaxID=84275 RepID=A0A9P3CIJ8_9PEZI|nr:uncharacterized protein CKM354_000672900 [Cercospora kikuchii]GIZ43504.1 hypothetical protein CKM354_000672900 [Cercospora kikuchii]
MRLLVFLTALLPSLGAFAATLEQSHSDNFVEQPEKRNYYRPTCGISGYPKKTYKPYKTIRRRCNQSQCSAYSRLPSLLDVGQGQCQEWLWGNVQILRQILPMPKAERDQDIDCEAYNKIDDFQASNHNHDKYSASGKVSSVHDSEMLWFQLCIGIVWLTLRLSDHNDHFRSFDYDYNYVNHSNNGKVLSVQSSRMLWVEAIAGIVPLTLWVSDYYHYFGADNDHNFTGNIRLTDERNNMQTETGAVLDRPTNVDPAAFIFGEPGDAEGTDQYVFDPADGSLQVLKADRAPSTIGQFLYYDPVTAGFGPPNGGGVVSFLVATSEADAAMRNGQKAVCAISSASQVSCAFGSSGTVADVWFCAGSIALVSPGSNPEVPCFGLSVTTRVTSVVFNTPAQ